MTDFKAKMHQIRFRLGSAPDLAGELTALPRPPSWIWGSLRFGGGAGLQKRRERGGEGEEGEMEGGKERAHKLLLNQGPSEPCYATASYSTICRDLGPSVYTSGDTGLPQWWTPITS